MPDKGNMMAVVCYENHAQDSRVKELQGASSPLNAKDGTGGNNLPLVVQHSTSFDPYEEGGVKSADSEVAHTVVNGTNPGHHNAVVVALDSLASNSMKSNNPESGSRIIDCAKTIDTSTQDSSKNQGGQVVCLTPWDCEAKRIYSMEGASPTLASGTKEGANIQPTVLCLTPWMPQTERVYSSEGVSPALPANSGAGQNRQAVLCFPLDADKLKPSNNADGAKERKGGNGFGIGAEGDPSYTLNTVDRHAVAVIAIDRASFNQGQNAQFAPQFLDDGSNPSLTAKGPSGVCLGVDRWNQAAKDGVMFSLRSAATGADRNDADPVVCYGIALDGRRDAPMQREVSQTETVGTNPGHKIGVCAIGYDGYNQQLTGDVAKAVTSAASDFHHVPCAIFVPCIVRRLTPTETERLMGFQDGWTAPRFSPERIAALTPFFIEKHYQWAVINGAKNPKRKTAAQVAKWLSAMGTSEQPDAPRYKACGNSMSINVMRWLGEGIQEVNR